MLKKSIVLGAGMTGLAAGIASGSPVFEASDTPGGICSSYYVRPGEKDRLERMPEDGEAYRFEIGGGHWIFGADSVVFRFIQDLTALKEYSRQASVHLEGNRYVPYPLQNNLRFLDQKTAARVLSEIHRGKGSPRTMKEWLLQSFGPTLCDLFFYPFHDLYTAGLYDRIAPQDAYKSPADRSLVRQGASEKALPAGYNTTFVYPEDGLNVLARRMAAKCDVHFGKRAIHIDIHNKSVIFDDGGACAYDRLVSTIPLNKILQLTDISTANKADPHTSVLVLNIGAKRGDRCPDDHWVYIPKSDSGFYRVGFYSNVDLSFLPRSIRKDNSRVGIYVERAYPGGIKPSNSEITKYIQNVIAELQEWDFIKNTEVVDPTWIDVAYTWSWPGSNWKEESIQRLEEADIHQVGRYGRWTFQGIAKSIEDGFFAGDTLQKSCLDKN